MHHDSEYAQFKKIISIEKHITSLDDKMTKVIELFERLVKMGSNGF